MRTIVLSDAHGEPDVISGVIDHSGFDPLSDRLIFAGDAIEVGRDSEAALALLDELHAEILVGNHEYALLVDGPLEAEQLSDEIEATVLERIRRGDWKLAAEADGVLVTHAGVSSYFADEFESVTEAGTVADFAEYLNRQFHDEISSYARVLDGVCGGSGPLWYRPRGGLAPLQGVVQVAGHTPVSLLNVEGEAERLAARGMYLIDPHVRRWRAQGYPPPAPLRYAVIENGAVRVVTD